MTRANYVVNTCIYSRENIGFKCTVTSYNHVSLEVFKIQYKV